MESHLASSKFFTGVIRWLNQERATYQTKKFDYDAEKEKDVAYWEQQFDNYIHRLEIFGFDSLAGTQAALKLAATAVALAEHLTERNGYPAPGVSSGILDLWSGIEGSRLNSHMRNRGES